MLQVLFHGLTDYFRKFKKPDKIIALIKSTKNAPTIGTIKNALCEGPKVWVIDCMLATAVGVAPRPKPQ